jgi:hypothetical protein
LRNQLIVHGVLPCLGGASASRSESTVIGRLRSPIDGHAVKGRTLSKGDIVHYQKIIVAIAETIRLMREIDEVIEAHGGWPGAFQARASGDMGSIPLAETVEIGVRS